MKSTSRKSILLFIMYCLLITPYANAQTKDNPLLIPELMDFTLMRCDFNTKIKDKQQIEDALQSGSMLSILPTTVHWLSKQTVKE